MELVLLDQVMQNDEGLDAKRVTGGLEILFEGGEQVGCVFLAVDAAEDFSDDGELKFFMGLVHHCVGQVRFSG